MGKNKNKSSVQICDSENDDSQSSSDSDATDSVLTQSIKFLKSYPMMPQTQQKAKRGRPSKKVKQSLSQILNSKEEEPNLNIEINEVLVCIKHLLSLFEGFKKSLTRLENKISIIEDKVDNIEDKVDNTSSSLITAQNRIQQLEETVAQLKEAQPARMDIVAGPTYADVAKSKAVVDLKANVDVLRQDKLNCDVYINGPTVKEEIGEPSEGEDLILSCKNLLKKITNSNEPHISKCYRARNNPNTLRIQFESSQSRGDLFKSFFKMKEKPFYMNEVLIAEKSKLFYELRILRKNLRECNICFFKSIFARHGEICYILETDVNRVHKISSMDDVRHLTEQSKITQATESA